MSDFQNLPRPAWHLVPIENYRNSPTSHGINRGFSMPMLASRGCPFQCTFCSSPKMWTTRYIMRDYIDVVDEVEELVNKYGIEGVDLCDLTAFTQKAWVASFCKEILKRNISVYWQLPSGTRSEALDEETLNYLYQIKCHDMVYAPESGSEKTLQQIKKKIHL
ncbi:MAG: radical SAM protein, partial [Planctomycetes bacterium]|nr:radical SAM protein [Planctomycetota bacterium]